MPEKVSAEKAEQKTEQKTEQKRLVERSKEEKLREEKPREKLEKPKEAKELREPKVPETKNRFMESLNKYFEKKNIEIIEKKIIKKSELDLLVRVPSAIGKVEYYCKAKDKKLINDGDIASAFVQGKHKNLPILFLTTGDITKRAKLMLDTEFKGVIFDTL